MLDPHLIAQTRPIAHPENIILHGNKRITVLTDRLFRIEVDDAKTFCDEATEAVWYRDMPPVPFTAEVDGDTLTVKTTGATLIVKEPIEDSIVILDGFRRPAKLDNLDNLGGTIATLDMCDGAYHVDWNSGRTPIKLEPGVVSKRGVAVLDYSTSAILGTDGLIHKRDHEEKDLYVFAYGYDFREAVKAYYMICGSTPKIPRFAFGNWWSRYHDYSEEEYLGLMNRFEKKQIPFTVATVDMDWHWSTTLDKVKGITAAGKASEYYGGPGGWTGYSWNTDLFPDYKRFLKRLHDKNLHVTLNLHPATGLRYFEDMYKEMAEAMGMDPAKEERIHFDFTDPKCINAYFKVIHKPYEHDGVDFWWIDWQQGPRAKAAGIDIMWVLNHYHTLDNGKEHAPLILSRYSRCGAHRYPLGFSGDTFMTWETLDYLPYFTATASNIGFTWWSHDIGGHTFGYKDDELYLRSIQFGVFSPINRLHCTNMPYCSKEPSVHMGGTGLIAEEFLRLRHQMIPYLYSAMIETSEDGKALIEPMYYVAPKVKDAYAVPNEYTFGTELIVAPVTTKSDSEGLAKVTVWLPEGRWTDIFNGNVYEGGRTLSMARPLDSIPVLAKSGGFLPLDGRAFTNDVKEPDHLRVLSFNGNGAYTLHEESGNTCFVAKEEDGKQTVTIKAESGVITRKMTLDMRNIKNGKVTVWKDGALMDAITYADDYLSIEIEDVTPDALYTVEVAFCNDPAAYRNDRFLYALTRLTAGHDRKEYLWNLAKRSDSILKNAILAENDLTTNEKIFLTEGW